MKHTHPATSADPKAMYHGMHSGHTEKKKGDSNERVINNYNFEDICAEHRTHGMYRGSEWPTCDHDIPNTTCGHYMNNDMNIGITNVSNYNTDSTCNCCPTSSNTPNQNAQKRHPPCQQTLLEQAMEYLYSLVFNHRSHCERCNPNLVCPRCKQLHSNNQPPCSTEPSPCPDDKPQNNKSSWLSSKFKKPPPAASPAYSNTTPTCPNATPKCPNIKPKCPNATPKCPNIKSTCPNDTPKCPNATPKCPNIKPKCPNATPKCPNATPSCPNAEQPFENDEQPCCIPEPPCPDPKPPCQKCPAAKANNNHEDCCKESLFELAKTYLQNIMYSHKNACPHCTQQLACCYAKELLKYLREIIEQAWIYTKQYYEQVCQEELEAEKDNKPCTCAAPKGNGNNLPCPPPPRPPPPCPPPSCPPPPCPPPSCPPPPCPPPPRPPPPCPPPPCPPVRCPVCFPEPEENDDDRFTPCCLHNSEGVQQPHHTSESHNKSCCLSRDFQSLSEPYDADIEPEISECSLDRESSGNLHDRNVMGLLSSNNGGPCKTCCKNCTDEPDNCDGNENGNGTNGTGNENENGNACGKRKLGLSLSMEPNDHRFCTNPNECKHSKESLNNCEDESPPPPPQAACGRGKRPGCPTNEQAEQADMPCTGGCKKCNTPNAKSKKRERRMPDDEYKKFLDDQLRKIENRLKDQGPLCQSNCNCLTCVTGNNCRTGTNKPEEKDEENYYYF